MHASNCLHMLQILNSPQGIEQRLWNCLDYLPARPRTGTAHVVVTPPVGGGDHGLSYSGSNNQTMEAAPTELVSEGDDAARWPPLKGWPTHRAMFASSAPGPSLK